jgi:Zn-dependent peptidase ImmA (M78 family)
MERRIRVEGNLYQICRYFEVSPQMVSYRIKHMGMTIEEAIFTPTKRAAK